MVMALASQTTHLYLILSFAIGSYWLMLLSVQPTSNDIIKVISSSGVDFTQLACGG